MEVPGKGRVRGRARFTPAQQELALLAPIQRVNYFRSLRLSLSFGRPGKIKKKIQINYTKWNMILGVRSICSKNSRLF